MMRSRLLAPDAGGMNRAGEPELYEFYLRGELSPRILAAFGELQATKRQGDTILVGPVQDQAALFGVLNRIESLGIHLIEVRLAQPNSGKATANSPI
jgi:hypothetical protein